MPTYAGETNAERAADIEFVRAHGLDPSQVTGYEYGTDEYFPTFVSGKRSGPKLMHVRFRLIMPMIISPRGVDLTAYGVPYPGPLTYPPAPKGS